MTRREYLNSWFTLVTISLILAAVVFFHLVDISSIPQGLFTDESAIGYNAWLIAQSGHDEHGHFFPLYFESFGDYKAPIYIYTVAAAFSLFGPSTLVLRATSAFYFGLFLIAITLLARRQGGGKWMAVYVLLAGGFLPWYFTLSRIAFEVMSYVTIMAWVVYFQFVAFHDPSTQNRQLPAALCGIFLGLAVYAYPTGRVTSFLYLAVLIALTAHRDLRRPLFALLAGFGAAIVPYIVYAVAYPEGLFARYNGMSYISDPTLGWFDKIRLFIGNYASHFSPKFLLLRGDRNLRHATGQGGEIFFTVFFLAVLTLFWFIAGGRWRRETFVASLGAGVIIAPVGAALTNEGLPHALRSSLLGLFILLLSCEGLRVLLRRVPEPRILICIIVAALALESALYLHGYFTAYVPKSRRAFETYGVEESIRRALAWGPSAVVTTHALNYAHSKFYAVALLNPYHISVEPGDMKPAPGQCLVYRSKDRASIDASPLPSVDLSEPGFFVGVRCFLH